MLALLAVPVLTERDGAEDKIPQLDHVVTASCPKIPGPDLFHMPRQKLPAGFVTAQVIRCRWESRYLPGKGKWEVVIEEHADGPADELMKELRRPSESSFFPAMCTMEAPFVDYFVVVDSSGKAVLPKLPTGVCGKPFRSALDALRHVPFQVDGQIPTRMLESEKSFQAGCYKKYLDALRLVGRPRGPQTRNRRRTWDPPPEGLRVCIFRTANKTSDRPNPMDIPWGRFESSRILKGRSMRALLAALDSAPASDCPSRHTRFAVLDSGYSEAYVELDGCRNLLRPGGTLGRLSPDAVALLTK